MKRLIENNIYNFLYSLKFVLIDKTIMKTLMEFEYKVNYILMLTATTILLITFLVSVYISSKVFNISALESSIIATSSYLMWDLAKAFFFIGGAFVFFDTLATKPINLYLNMTRGYSLRDSIIIIIELSLLLILDYKHYKSILIFFKHLALLMMLK